MPEAGRGAANVLLDAVIANGVDEDWTAAVGLAIQRLGEIDDVYRVTITDEDEAHLEIGNLIGGTLVAMQWLIAIAAEGQGVSQEEIISDLRAWLSR